MFDFKKKHLNPVLKQFVERINGALPLKGAEQMASFLDLKKVATDSLNKIARSEHRKSVTTMFATLATTGGLIAAAVLMPAAAIAASVAAGAVFIAGLAGAQKFSLNEAAASRGRYVLTEKIDAEVIQSLPNLGFSATTPEFKTMLAQSFDAAANKEEYKALAKRAMKSEPPKAKAQPVAAAK